MKNELAQVDIRTPAQLQLFRLGNRQGYGPLLEDGEMNTDYHPLLEFGAARSRFFNTEVAALNQLGRDPVPVLDILSGFPGSAPVLGSTIIAAGHPRFGDVLRGNAFAVALTDRSAPLSQLPLQEADVEAATRLRDLARNVDEASWNDWFAALVFASKPMTPNGAAPALATFIRSGDVAVRLAGAPPELRAKVEFLLLVAARDLPRIRTEGIRLLAGPLQAADPAFHAYTLVATVAACLRAPREEGCPATIALLDTVQRRHLVFDLLRAHQRALR